MITHNEFVDSLDGEGTLSLGEQSFHVQYHMDVLQDIDSYVSGGVGKTLRAALGREGYLYFLGNYPPARLSNDEPILTLEDGRRFKVVFPELAARDRVAFVVNGDELGA